MLPMSEKLKNTNGESVGLRTENIDRRRFLRRAAVTTAWAVPVISTFSAKPAYAACVPAGAQCGVVTNCSGNGTCDTTGFGTPCCTTTLTCKKENPCSVGPPATRCVCR